MAYVRRSQNSRRRQTLEGALIRYFTIPDFRAAKCIIAMHMRRAWPGPAGQPGGPGGGRDGAGEIGCEMILTPYDAPDASLSPASYEAGPVAGGTNVGTGESMFQMARARSRGACSWCPKPQASACPGTCARGGAAVDPDPTLDQCYRYPDPTLDQWCMHGYRTVSLVAVALQALVADGRDGRVGGG